ncbi:MAG: HAD-IB family hydrolase [Sphingobacteriales bacterium]|nr:MAG: HAD-IB family hydrolase [Sphingobacteriales bacterium]
MDLALFDFDGTITSKDTFTSFIHFAVRPKKLALGKIFLAPLVAGYKLGIFPGSILRSSVSWLGFKNEQESDLNAVGLKYSQEFLPTVIRPKALERIEWHKNRGDVVVVVSASLSVYLTNWCKNYGINLICTELESKNGVLTGYYQQGDCSYARKASRILQKFNPSDYSMIYAYGDTKEDFAMLDLAQKKYYRWKEISNTREINNKDKSRAE